MNTKPAFPIKVIFHEDNSVHIFNNEDEMVCDLEWFDTEDPDENATVTDANGQAVRLKIEALNIETFELLHTGFTNDNDMDIDQSCNMGKISVATKQAKNRNNNSSRFVSTIGNGLLCICYIILFIPAAIIMWAYFLSCSMLKKIKHGHQ